MAQAKTFGPDVLELPDPQATIDAIAEATVREIRAFRRRGAVVGLSGGVDSSVVAALAARAFGPDHVLGVFMPERDSSSDTLALARLAAQSCGIETVLEDITPILDAVGCYRRRDEAIRQVIPAFSEGWRAKLVLPSVLDSERFRIFSVVVEAPDGRQTSERLPADAYLQIVAATNFKQRTRKMLEYYHADRLNYAVLGTPNRLEYDQGFFVKNGDGAADVKPIAHLYKTQVYQIGKASAYPMRSCRGRPPPTRTRCPRARTSSTSRFPTTRWTCACTRSTTACPPSPSRMRWASPWSRSSASTTTSRLNVVWAFISMHARAYSRTSRVCRSLTPRGPVWKCRRWSSVTAAFRQAPDNGSARK